MRIAEARKVFNFTQSQISETEVKQTYRKLSKTYHPDINAQGAEMMKLINSAYEVLSALSFPYSFEEEINTDEDFLAKFESIFSSIINLEGLIIEIVGTWVWITGETKKNKEELKKAGFFYSSKKKAWYFNPEPNKKRFYRGKKSLDEIKGIYGSKRVQTRKTSLLHA